MALLRVFVNKRTGAEVRSLHPLRGENWEEVDGIQLQGDELKAQPPKAEEATPHPKEKKKKGG